MSNQRTHKVTGVDGEYRLILRSGLWRRRPSIEIKTPGGKELVFDFHKDEDMRAVNEMIASSGYRLARESLESFPVLMLAEDSVADSGPPPNPGAGVYPIGGKGFATHIVDSVKEGTVYMRKTARATEQCSYWKISDDHPLTETPARIFWIIWRRAKKPKKLKTKKAS